MGDLITQSSYSGFNGELVKPSKGAFACMINSEIGAVLAVMRRNVRWGVRYVADDDQLEHSLIHSLKELRKQIFSWGYQCQNVDPVVYLQPFLDVIKSDETGAPITGVALSSIYKILTLDVLDVDSVNVEEAMHLIVDAVMSCRFEVTDPASEELVLMKILQVLLACMKSKAATRLSNKHVCMIANTCFRIVHQASSKGELLQRIARHTMHELIRCIFSHLPEICSTEHEMANESLLSTSGVVGKQNGNLVLGSSQVENGNVGTICDGSSSLAADTYSPSLVQSSSESDTIESGEREEKTDALHDERLMSAPFGIPCMVEIFQFLCSLLNVIENIGISPKSNPVAYDEDVPLFSLGLINSAIELGGPSLSKHPKLFGIIQDELFRNLMQFGLSLSPLILSTVCSIVLNLYYHLRSQLKVQLEAFFSCVLLKLAQSKHGSSYQQQEVALEALVDLCRQQTFVAEMYANYDYDITCSNVFEDIVNLLSKSAFPVNGPLSAMHILALDGLVSTNYSDPNSWIPFVRKMKNFKRKLAIGADHFNRDPKKGLEFLQGIHLLPDKLDPESVASFFRYTTGLDKNLIGDFLGNHDEFCVQVLHEFVKTFDFSDMNLDSALRVFLGTFRLPGESQKIQRVLEAFAERYYELSPHILCNKDAALLLSYSLILLNTDQHNVQVKKKMTEEDFIRNNRLINGGKDLPREYLSELYHSICENEIQMIPDQGSGFSVMTSSRWINVVHKSKESTPFIACDSRALLDLDMFSILSGPTIAAISVVFDQVEHEDVLQMYIEGFLAVAKISAHYRSGDVLDDLVVSLCKFTNLSTPLSIEEAIVSFGDDARARMATTTVFTIANSYGDCIHSGWKNILDCVLTLHKLDLLPAYLASDAADEIESSSDHERGKPATSSLQRTQTAPAAIPQKSSSLIGRFSQFLSFDMEEPNLYPTEEELAAQQCLREIVQECHIDNILMESKFLQAESLLQLVDAIIFAACRFSKGIEDENTAVFCLELLITITLNNRDRILIIWQKVYKHISDIVQQNAVPCTLVEKAVFGLLKICQRLLPYKENITDELLKSMQLILKLDARVADAYCEPITQEVMHLVKANATHIRSHLGWRTIISLLFITARHPEASEFGFEALAFIMYEGAHLLPSNYVLCVDAAREFAESRVAEVDRSISALDMMAGSVVCLVRWSFEAWNAAEEEAALEVSQDIGEMWLRLVRGLRAGSSSKEYRKMEGTLVLATKLLSKAFLLSLQDLLQQPSFCKLWLGVLDRMERCMKVKFRGKRGEKMHEFVPELLKNTLLVMKTTGVLVPSDDLGGESFWQLTWLHVKNIAPSLQSEVFTEQELEQFEEAVGKSQTTNLFEDDVKSSHTCSPLQNLRKSRTGAMEEGKLDSLVMATPYFPL
ncbi:ARF guanine-nucleotide exchange factor GNL1 [Hibiscus syriacus]|uniref:ARF guanine-nucleotide exchange factor GNL1 n=1 Tax=Hibiscus syriacus TaxID=106335 RepID=A0A6A3C6S9_HIBSY|nr:ARF guanine-nucleotide exchange factor GNL1 [Hibiscus syriacus]